MTPSHQTTLDPSQIHGDSSAVVETDPASVSVLRMTYRQLRNRMKNALRMACLKRSGPKGFGRLAARVAAWETPPFHGRSFLADATPRGFIAASASVTHPGLALGKNVYIGDNVVISRWHDGDAVQLHDKVHLYGNSFLDTARGGRIVIGEGTHIQPGCHLHAHISDIRIGKSVEIAAGCGFFPYNHGMEPDALIMDQPLESDGGIFIGDGAWLGYRVTVLQNVTIGAGAVIAAGSVVVKDIPANAIAAGVPAKVIKFRSGRNS